MPIAAEAADPPMRWSYHNSEILKYGQDRAASSTTTASNVILSEFPEKNSLRNKFYKKIRNNRPPLAVDDGGFTATAGVPVSIPAAALLANDSDPDGDSITIIEVGGAVGGTVTVDASQNVVFTSIPDYQGAASFIYTISDGRGGTDIAIVEVTVENTPLSIWNGFVTPAIITVDDPNAVELGVKISSNVDGYVLGIRFYKGPQNIGKHTVNLWTASGVLLASAASANETASGWQQVMFVQPVPISAGAIYVASYHSEGYYSADHDYFSTIGVERDPLHALGIADGDGNGVYAYGTSSAFPTETWRASNYWVDVVFAVSIDADTQPPTDPSNLTTSSMASEINLSWDASTDDTGVAGYEIERDGEPLATTTNTTYRDRGLATNTAYKYGVTAFDAAGNVSSTVTTGANTLAATTPVTDPSESVVQLGDGADLGGMLPFPSDNPWNQDISAAPVDPSSDSMIANLGNPYMHPDFGTWYNGTRNGISYIVVPEDQPMMPINFYGYASVSDPGPYPIPPEVSIKGDGVPDGEYNDRHMVIVQRDISKPNQLGKLYETFLTLRPGETNEWFPQPSDEWAASNGAVFDLNSNGQRPPGWTSADAAGLPIFPGLVRYDEVQRAIDEYNNGGEGLIHHALRFTLEGKYTRRAYVFPATHQAGSGTADNLVPFGARLRLKASVDISGLPPEIQVIARTLKKHGMFMADNGGNLFLSGAPDDRWDNDTLRWIRNLKANDFEIVKMGTIITPY